MDKLLDEKQLAEKLEALNLGSSVPWQIIDGKLHKQFTFSGFVEAFGFMTMAALVAERMDHHPKWTNVYTKVEIDLLTHRSGGITSLDFALAGAMEKLARR